MIAALVFLLLFAYSVVGAVRAKGQSEALGVVVALGAPLAASVGPGLLVGQLWSESAGGFTMMAGAVAGVAAAIAWVRWLPDRSPPEFVDIDDPDWIPLLEEPPETPREQNKPDAANPWAT